ncbi:MAG TPA: TetR/AcrR family transcriptional regulator [Chthoniobacteraceae bacterium]|nr:TetR/AcrR family transcriptional regulator [Chthoniobacteraceae bacterium]
MSPTSTPPAPGRKTGKRDLILDAARDCFARHGFHATGMAEICETAGMSPGNLYRYFPSKSAIILAIVDETRKEVMPIYHELGARSSSADPVEGVEQIMLHCTQHLCHHRESRLWTEILAEASRNEEVRRSYLLFNRELRDVLERLLEAAVAMGRLAREFNPKTGAAWLIALLDGAITRRCLDPEEREEALLETLTSHVRRMLSPAEA